MKAREGFIRNKLFHNIMKMILLVLIPAVVLGLYTFFHAKSTAVHNASQTAQRQLEQAVNEIDMRLENLVNLYSILDNDKELTAIKMNGDTSALNVQHLRNGITTLNSVIKSNSLINEAFIYNGGERVLSSVGIFETDYYFSKYRIGEDYPVEKWDELISQCRRLTFLAPTVLHEKSNQRYTLRTVVPTAKIIYLSDGKALAVFFLDIQAFQNIIRQYIPFDTTFSTIAAPGNVMLLAEEAPEDVSCAEFSCVSDQNGWEYHVSVSVDEIYSLTSLMMLRVPFIVLTVLVLGLALALIIGWNFYRPLRVIQNTLDPEKNNAANTLSELKEQTVDLAESSSAAQSQLSDLAQNYVEDALFDQSITEKKAELLQTVMAQHLGFHGGPYQCVAIRFLGDESNTAEILRETFAKYLPTCSIDYNEQILLLITESDTVHFQSIIDVIATELFEKLTDTINGIAVGYEISLAKDLYKSLNASLTALQHVDPAKRNALIFAQDFDISNQYIYTYRDELTLIEALQRGGGERLHHLLDNILLVNYEKCVSHQQMQQLFEQLRNTAYRYAQQERLYVPPHIYRRAALLDSMREEVYNLYDALMANKVNPSAKVHVALAQSADEYIAQHCAEDIYLDTVADALGVSAKHLSKIYKQQRNINITDQIAFVRVEKAKELLRNTDMTVNEIMIAAGFISRATFLRAFKKYTDISPSVYRQLHYANASIASIDPGFR